MAESYVSFKDTSGDSPSHIPEELLNFIRRDTYSLLVKGFAGTGKTTLALTILNVLGITNNFFYISTRTSPKQLFQYYPWLKDLVVRSKPRGTSVPRGYEAMSSFEDARLDEPESLFERITNQLMDIKSPIIIIDSWDAIASFMDREARLNNERVLQTWRERAGAKLIFISEQPADISLEFLVDGIVELKQSFYKNVKIRQMFLQKLRGTPIKRASYLYTLESGIFHSFVPYQPAKFEPHKGGAAAEVSALAAGNNIKTGYSILDGSLGSGFQKKDLVLLELGSHVNMTVAMIFLQRIVSSFILGRNPVLLFPVNWLEPSSILRFFEAILPAGKKSLFKILWAGKPYKISNNIISLSKKNDTSCQLLAALVNMKQRHRDKLLLNIMYAEAIENLHGAGKLRNRTKNTLSSIMTRADLSIVVLTRSQEDILEVVSELSNIHLRFLIIKDTLFLQSLAPSSNLYSVLLDTQSQMNLKAVV
ncbi:MAG TPA: gas vesicle protein GvpD P-loop domain-containing protein [Nitrososphaera sp.]|nr:gas vesicle protein GvpD P-loop domain-containing protein [Nitrososphaera sp.]